MLPARLSVPRKRGSRPISGQNASFVFSSVPERLPRVRGRWHRNAALPSQGLAAVTFGRLSVHKVDEGILLPVATALSQRKLPRGHCLAKRRVVLYEKHRGAVLQQQALDLHARKYVDKI